MLYNTNMKYLVASDLHGSLEAYALLQEIYEKERPDKVILLGDLSRHGYIDETIRCFLRQLPCPLTVKGNCDKSFDGISELDYVGEYHIEHAFERTLFFCHGYQYNALYLPPVLQEGDAFFYGHSHMDGYTKRAGIYVANCGSLSSPRGNCERSYLIIEEKGVTFKYAETSETIAFMAFDK